MLKESYLSLVTAENEKVLTVWFPDNPLAYHKTTRSEMVLGACTTWHRRLSDTIPAGLFILLMLLILVMAWLFISMSVHPRHSITLLQNFIVTAKTPVFKCRMTTECPPDYYAFYIKSGAANVVNPNICFENKTLLSGPLGNAGSGMNIAVLNSITGEVMNTGSFDMYSGASMYSDLRRDQHKIDNLVAQPDYLESTDNLIKPKKLFNPVKASRSHQELHRELLMNHKRGLGIDSKPELQRVLEQRKREQMNQQKKKEEEARRLKSPLAAELQKRQLKLEEVEKEQQQVNEEAVKELEFIKVKENLRRTSIPPIEEKEV
ncbi:F107A protein, partial [Polypterus senegalus]